MMQSQRVTGPGAGAEKYDLLTAMAVNGLSEGGTKQASMMRLIALVTSRYNWAADEVTIGQREMAALWSVDERTAKRETRRLIELGLIEIKRAGVRGRVAAYRLRREEIYRQTAENWRNVGPDFDARMSARQNPAPEAAAPREEVKVVKVDFAARVSPAKPQTPWQKTMARLALDNPGLHAAWFAQLEAGEPDDEGLLLIHAPSRFVAGYVASHHLALIEKAASLAYGQSLRCKLIG